MLVMIKYWGSYQSALVMDCCLIDLGICLKLDFILKLQRPVVKHFFKLSTRDLSVLSVLFGNFVC